MPVGVHALVEDARNDQRVVIGEIKDHVAAIRPAAQPEPQFGSRAANCRKFAQPSEDLIEPFAPVERDGSAELVGALAKDGNQVVGRFRPKGKVKQRGSWRWRKSRRGCAG